MSQNKEVTKSSDRLDVEFKKLLCVIREHIPYINSNDYLTHCRLWLEKLSSNVDKVQRNLYLAELCQQIQKNMLSKPFNEAPPNGKLTKLGKVLENTCNFFKKDTLYDQSRHKISNVENNYEPLNRNRALRPRTAENVDSFVEPLKSDEETSEIFVPLPIQTLPKLKSIKNDIQKIPKTMQNDNDMNCSGDTINTFEKIQKKNDGYDKNEGIVLESKYSKEIAIDNDSSWSDLTDSASIELVYMSEDVKKKRVDKINNQKVPKKARTLHEESQKIKIFTDNNEKFIANNNSPCCFEIKNLSEAVKDSTFKVPKDTNFIFEDWKNTIEALQLRLSEMIHQNRELKIVIQQLEMKIDDEAVKNKEDINYKLKLAEERHYGDLEKIKEIHAHHIFNLEKSLENKIRNFEKEYQEKIVEFKNDYDNKTDATRLENEKVLKKKDEEIFRLTEIIQQQCVRITNEISNLQTQVSSCSCDKKLLLLRKCVSKMDRLFQRSEKEYLRQIERLKQELDIKTSALQIQLKTQKAELMVQTSSERQEEFENILNSLEVKYIKILESHEAQIMEIKELDNKTIESLKDIISQHGKSCNCHND